MQITQAMLDVCEEALYHLRQDVTLPTLADIEHGLGDLHGILLTRA